MTLGTTNIERKHLNNSIFIIPIAIPIFGIVHGLLNLGDFVLADGFKVILAALTYGAIFWFPILVIVFIIERFFIKTSHSKSYVRNFILVETIVALFISIVPDPELRESPKLLIAFSIAIVSMQLCRWWYLSKRFDNGYNESNSDATTIDG